MGDVCKYGTAFAERVCCERQLIASFDAIHGQHPTNMRLYCVTFQGSLADAMKIFVH